MNCAGRRTVSQSFSQPVSQRSTRSGSQPVSKSVSWVGRRNSPSVRDLVSQWGIRQAGRQSVHLGQLLAFAKVVSCRPSGFFPQLSSLSVDENSDVDTVVGALSTVDADNGQRFLYTMLDSAGGRFKITGQQVKVGRILTHGRASQSRQKPTCGRWPGQGRAAQSKGEFTTQSLALQRESPSLVPSRMLSPPCIRT